MSKEKWAQVFFVDPRPPDLVIFKTTPTAPFNLQQEETRQHLYRFFPCFLFRIDSIHKKSKRAPRVFTIKFLSRRKKHGTNGTMGVRWIQIEVVHINPLITCLRPHLRANETIQCFMLWLVPAYLHSSWFLALIASFNVFVNCLLEGLIG